MFFSITWWALIHSTYESKVSWHHITCLMSHDLACCITLTVEGHRKAMQLECPQNFNLPEEHFRVGLSQKLHSFEWNSISIDIFQFYDVSHGNRQQHLPAGLPNLIHMILSVGSRKWGFISTRILIENCLTLIEATRWRYSTNNRRRKFANVRHELDNIRKSNRMFDNKLHRIYMYSVNSDT